MSARERAGGGDQPPRSVRLFVAVDLPEDVRRAVEDWRAPHVAQPGLRAVAPDALHLTLAFIGHRPGSDVERIAAAVGATAAPVPGLLLGPAAWLPGPRRPRVLVVRVEDREGRLAALQAAVSAALVEAARHAPESRPFLAHVTVGRVRPNARVAALSGPAPPPLPFAARALTLYSSRLSPRGARYQPLARTPL